MNLNKDNLFSIKPITQVNKSRYTIKQKIANLSAFGGFMSSVTTDTLNQSWTQCEVY